MRTRCRYLLLPLTVITAFYVAVVIYFHEPVTTAEGTILWRNLYEAHDRSAQEPITIQWSNDFFGDDPYSIWPAGKAIFIGCPVVNCEFLPRTSARTADVLIFHNRDPVRGPLKRLSSQKYVFFTWESEVYGLHEHSALIQYNLTMTYRLDSDVPIPYLKVIKTRETNQLTHRTKFNFATGKSKPVAWVVSNCETSSKREVYVKELIKYIDIDIYGQCGTLACDKTTCFSMINSTYKFFLAFENSFCDDYMTEKLLRILELGGTVPVVMGGANYSKLLPPHSVIDVFDFPSPQALAEYLHKLDSDDTLYNEYFEWSAHYNIVNYINLFHCGLCEYLNLNRNQTQILGNIKDWFNPSRRCREINWSF